MGLIRRDWGVCRGGGWEWSKGEVRSGKVRESVRLGRFSIPYEGAGVS